MQQWLSWHVCNCVICGMFVNRLLYVKSPGRRVCACELGGHGAELTETPTSKCGGTCVSTASGTPCISSIFIFASLAGDFHITLLVTLLTIMKRSIFSMFICHSVLSFCKMPIHNHHSLFLWVVNHFLVHKSSPILSKYALFWSYVLQMFSPACYLPLILHIVF